MTVYVESNFVLEAALEQEEWEACAAILELASTGAVKLVIPSFSLSEPYQAIAAKAKVRSRLGEDLRTHVTDLIRSRTRRDYREPFENLLAVIASSQQSDKLGLQTAVSALLNKAEVIALDGDILRSAMDTGPKFGLSHQDAIVLSSILQHLAVTKPALSCFLNRNSKDFEDPGIREELQAQQCRFFARFGKGLDFIRSTLGREEE